MKKTHFSTTVYVFVEVILGIMLHLNHLNGSFGSKS